MASTFNIVVNFNSFTQAKKKTHVWNFCASPEKHIFSTDECCCSVAYPGWHTPGVQTEDGVLAPPGKLKNGAPRRRCWMGEGGSMLEVIISFSDNVIGIRLLKIALTLN